MQDIKKFVINLKRRPDRLELFQKACPFKDVEVVHGFDGKNISSETSQTEKLMIYRFTKLKPGEVGVFISHLRIFKEIVDKDIPFAFIMEDDAIFCDDFSIKYPIILSEMPSHTDLLYVGGRFDPGFKMVSCSQITDNIVGHIIHNKKILEAGSDTDRTLHAYIISNKMAKILVNTFNTCPRIDKAIDDWIMRVSLDNSLPIYNAQPLLCHSPLKGDSDIR